MFRKNSELQKAVQTDFRGGKGQVFFEHFMDEALSNGAGRLFARSTLPPGASVGLHKHEGDCEIYYILSGKAEVMDDGVPVELGPGDIQFCADGSSHSIENIGQDDLSYIAIILYTKQKDLSA